MCEEPSTAKNPDEPQMVEDKIIQWLTLSGRDIELRVARAVRQAGAVAVHSVPYEDLVTGKEREADVMAEFDGRGGSNVAVTLVIECKRADGKHWVAFPHDGGYLSSHPIRHHAVVQPPGDSVEVGLLEEHWGSAPGPSSWSASP